MRKFAIGLVFLALVLPLAPTELRAQTSSSVVVAICGTPPTTYVAGHPYPNTQDTTGTLCTKGGTATNATIVGPLGRQADAASVSTALSTEDVALLNSIVTNTGGAIPAGTNVIGKSTIDNTTPGTTNNVAVSTNGAGNTPLIQATASLPISSTGAATTLLLAASGSTTIYVTHVHYVLSGAGTVALIAGTGSTCAGSTHYLDGASGHPMSFAANGGISAGGGIGYIYKTNASDALCIVTTGSVDTSGDFSYAQF